MAERSRKAFDSQKIKEIQNALTFMGWSHERLGDEAGVSASTARKFWEGKGVDRANFLVLCEKLDLDWRSIAGIASVEPLAEQAQSAVGHLDIEALVGRLRSQGSASIQKRCGEMRVLDMTTPIGLGSIYIDLKFLDSKNNKIDGKLLAERTKQLMILGGPGTGKTTFLKQLAMLCNHGHFLETQVPFFIPIKRWLEEKETVGLLEFVQKSFTEPIDTIQKILLEGRSLILIDELDQILEKDHDRVLMEIRKISELNRENNIVITSRIAARISVRKDTFQTFTEVKIAKFNEAQIQSFSSKWFLIREPECVNENGQSTAGDWFWEQLSDRKSVKDLASNPLLLTLLCFDFESSADFPESRIEIYERVLRVLLSQWNENWGFKYDSVYGRLSVDLKKQLLGKLAFIMFERDDNSQQHLLEQKIKIHMRSSPNLMLIDSGEILRDITVQHGLINEHSIGNYSFSQLVLHEYLVAQSIIDISNTSVYEKTLNLLISHVSDKRWREVFLLVTEKSDADDAEYLLTRMKAEIDGILRGDEKLQKFMIWLNNKTVSIHSSYKSASVRAFYLALFLNFSQIRPATSWWYMNDTLDFKLAWDLDRTMFNDVCTYESFMENMHPEFDGEPISNSILTRLLSLQKDFYFVGTVSSLNATNSKIKSYGPKTFRVSIDNQIRKLTYDLNQIPFDNHNCKLNMDIALDYFCDHVQNSELQIAIKEIRTQLPNECGRFDESFNLWWQEHGQSWTAKLIEILIGYYNIGHDWQFSESQKELLQKYYDANKLLVDCLNSECYANRQVLQHIEDTLLLPLEN